MTRRERSDRARSHGGFVTARDNGAAAEDTAPIVHRRGPRRPGLRQGVVHERWIVAGAGQRARVEQWLH